MWTRPTIYYSITCQKPIDEVIDTLENISDVLFASDLTNSLLIVSIVSALCLWGFQTCILGPLLYKKKMEEDIVTSGKASSVFTGIIAIVFLIVTYFYYKRSFDKYDSLTDIKDSTDCVDQLMQVEEIDNEINDVKSDYELGSKAIVFGAIIAFF